MAIGAVVVIGFAVLGVVLLRGGSAAGAPTIVRGQIPLGFAPRQVGFDIPRNDSFYLTDGETLTRIEVRDREITATTQATPGTAQVVALSGVGFHFAAKTVDARVLVLASFSAAVEGDVALPAPDCCADVLVGTDDGFFLFPEKDGRSSSYLEYDATRQSWQEQPLPASITVTGAAFFDGFLYIAHTGGLFAVSPYDGCGDPIVLWDRPTAALAVTNLDEARPTIGALDTESRAIASIDPGTTAYHQVEDCGSVEPPRTERVVAIGDLSANLQPTLAMFGGTVYVIDGHGTVYIADIASGTADLVREVQLPGGPTAGATLIAAPDWLANQWSVFVADPAGARLWWIAAGGPESPEASIEPV